MVVISWYEHGIRFFHVDPATGKITQKGYFQPVATQAGAAHWVTAPNGDKYVLAPDYARGVDILKFTPEGPNGGGVPRLVAGQPGHRRAVRCRRALPVQAVAVLDDPLDPAAGDVVQEACDLQRRQQG